MEILSDIDLNPGRFERSVVTIGNFDGVHLGHRELLGRIRDRAKELDAVSVVYTFHPHPLRVLNPARCPAQLTGFDQKARRIEREGIDCVIRARFDREYAQRSPEIFALETLGTKLRAAEVWVGPDFGFGKDRRGNVETLTDWGKQAGYFVRMIDQVVVGGEVVSSTAVRRAVREGDFKRVEKFLGRLYGIVGVVSHGDGRGAGLGYPTVNLATNVECIPHDGVYAGWAKLNDGCWRAAINVGSNPTFGGSKTLVEAYFLEFEGDLYGKELELFFVEPIRGEIAFKDVAALVDQIGRDVETVDRILDGREFVERVR